jgi:hypothetical protein
VENINNIFIVFIFIKIKFKIHYSFNYIYLHAQSIKIIQMNLEVRRGGGVYYLFAKLIGFLF